MANLTNPFQATAFPTMNKNFLGNAFTPTDTSGDSKSFPGLTVNEENEIFSACDNANMTQYERNLLANDLYKKKIEQKNSEKKNQEKAAAHLELVNKAAITTDPKTKNSLNNTARKHEVADMIRNYVMNANGKDLTDVDDGQLIHDFSQENQQAAMAIDEFINGNESSSYFSKKMGFSQQDEEKEQSGFEQWLTGLGDRFQAFGRGVDNLLSKGQSAVDESGVDLNAYTKYIQDKYGVSYPAKLDKATRDKEYETVKENPELLKPYMTSTSDDVLDVAEGGVDIAFSSFNPYATAAFTTAGGLESLMGGGALTWFGEKMGGIGSVINELPGLSQFRDSLSEENQARFDQFVANSALGLMLGVKNKSNIYKNPKQFLVENLQPNQITKNFMENVVGISEKAYSGIQRAGNFARGIEGGSLSKMASRMTNGLDGLSEWGAEKLTKTSSAQDKLYKAQEPRMNVLSEKKNLEQRRANSDRANQLIVENGYKPTNTSERLQAHDATLKKLWNDVLTEVNKGEGVFADQSSIINALDEYIKNQKELGIDASKADIKALEGELNAMKKQQAKGELDFPTLEKKKQVYNDLIDWKGTEASEVYKKGIKLITSEIGKLEDAMLSEIPGEFSQLKRDVGALIDTYEDVFKADMKNQRKKGLGLTETYSRLEGISDTLGGIFQLFKGDVSGVAKGLSKVALGKAMAKATDVDFLVKKGFEELSKSFEENQVSSKTAPKIQEGIKTDQAVFDELSNYILDVNKEYSAEDISALGEMIDKSRKSLSREDYQTLKDALREQIQNRDLAIEEAEWLRTEGKAIEMGEDIKAVKEFQKRILEIEEQEKNIGKVAGKKVNRTYADQQMRAWESKREKLIKELEEYYNIDQYEASAKYDELLERANINDFRKDSNRGKYQEYGTALEDEKSINASEGLNIRDFKTGKTAKELADNYGIKTNIVDNISTPEGQKAYGMYGKGIITLARDLKESTVPHELLHATFDMVDSAKRTKILEGIQKRLKVDDIQAEEWLADNFSEYYRTGKFDTKAVPTTLAGQIKQFFQQIKEFIDGTYANRKEITQLFDDIIDGKIEGEYGAYSDPKFQEVRHGSSALFDKFDSSHMGEGEGNQVHGWGHYVAVNKNTSKKYANLKYTPAHKSDSFVYKDTKGEFQPNVYSDKKRFVNNILDYINDLNPYSIGNKPTKAKIKNMIKEEKGYLKEYIKEGEDAIRKIKNGEVDPNDMMSVEEIQSAINSYKNDIKTWDSIDINEFEIPFHEAEGERHLYSVDIPDPKKADTPTGRNYLEEKDFIAPEIADEFTKKVLESGLEVHDGSNPWGVRKLMDSYKGGPDNKVSVKNLYHVLQVVLGSDKAASQFLNDMGYDGIHYFGGIDGEAYVIFNDDALNIKNHQQY